MAVYWDDDLGWYEEPDRHPRAECLDRQIDTEQARYRNFEPFMTDDEKQQSHDRTAHLIDERDRIERNSR